MKEIYKSYLFSKKILVGETIAENSFEGVFTLANKFGIKITKGQEYASLSLIEFVSERYGKVIPEAFYKGFPKSVLSLTKEQLLFDQLFNYYVTYGFNNFDEPNYSIFEKDFDKIAFKEKVEPKKFVILSEEEAYKVLLNYVQGMLDSSRPLSEVQYQLLKAYILDFNYSVENCVCKDTIIKLLLDTRNYNFAKFLYLSDVIKVVDILNFNEYKRTNIKNLKLCSKDRKFIIKIIYTIFENKKVNIKDCFEKKAIWCGLLHHIHVKPISEPMQEFFNLMRKKGNLSAYSPFEKAMSENDVILATKILKNQKGESSLLRNLNYILSRCKSNEEVEMVLNSIDSQNKVVLIQLLLQYAFYKFEGARNFKFTKFNMVKVHEETNEEVSKRKSVLDKKIVEKAQSVILNKLETALKNKLGKVYIEDDMYSIAVPIQENTSNGGLGVLPRGSKIAIEKGKKIRAFTYWEKVNDIDLSVIGVTKDGSQQEFSWRTMYENQSKGIVYSGDTTSGYEGGVEYFDVDVKEFKKAHPTIKKLVFCNNVYSEIPFKDCVCKAGYMVREVEDSGKAYEYKTVQSSFIVDADSTFAYLFGIDLENSTFVWLNSNKQSNEIIAGRTDVSFLLDYFEYTSVINIGSLFKMMATEIVDNPLDADVIVSNTDYEGCEEKLNIKNYDFEKVTALLK